MEYNLEKVEMPKSLFTDFGQWARLEDYFKQQLSPKDLESRRFRNMKLKEYNRLLRTYTGAMLTRDEQALMAVMKFQRGSLVRALYPGLLSRMFYLVSKGVDNMLFYNKEVERVKMASDERIINTKITVPDESQSATLKKDKAVEGNLEQHHKRYGPDLGQRSVGDEQHKPKGPSI